MTVSYRVIFPAVELTAIHGNGALNEAIELLKSPEYFKMIRWMETHTEECECLKCKDGSQ